MYCIANNPGRPVKEMWNEKAKTNELITMPPPGLGRFGISAYVVTASQTYSHGHSEVLFYSTRNCGMYPVLRTTSRRENAER